MKVKDILRICEKAVSFFVRIQMFAASSFLIFMALIIVEGVFMRYVLRSPQAYSVEFARFSLMPVTALALAYTQKMKGHVRVELLIMHLSKRVNRILDVVCNFVFILYAGSLLFASYTMTTEYFIDKRISEDFGLALWIVSALMLTGIVALLLQLVMDMVMSIIECTVTADEK